MNTKINAATVIAAGKKYSHNSSVGHIQQLKTNSHVQTWQNLAIKNNKHHNVQKYDI